ncbi:MAG: metal ABC transporter permease [Oleiphilaceae bacterium]|nr:metal ABC transporter permease [Oleiphilaceae bacterium]
MADWLWLSAPVAASLLMAIALVPLGQRVLARGVVFADLAIAQWAALGSLAAGRLFPPLDFMGVPVSSLASALLAVALVHLILRWVADYREAMIGTLYVLGASLATLVISDDPHGAQQLAQTLNGDLLWVTPAALIPLGVMAALVIGWQLALPERLRAVLFLPLFALAVTITVNQAGIYVVFASLIAAPLALCRMRRYSVWWAVAVCFIGHALGLTLSASFDLPAGATIVTATIGCSGAALMLLRRRHHGSSFLATPSPAHSQNKRS